MAPKVEQVHVALQDELAECLKQLRTSEKFSDLTIKCGDREFKAHKAIVCSRSPYFEAACSPGFREGQEGVIKLATADELESTDAAVGNDPQAVQYMIDYFYGAEYTPTHELLVTHAKVFAAATKFQVPGLKTLSALKFGKNLQSIDHANPSDTTDLAQAIKLVHRSTPDNVPELRDAMSDALVQNRKLSGSMVIGEAINSIEGLAYALFQKSQGLSARPGGLKPCSNCDEDVDGGWKQCLDCRLTLPNCHGCTVFGRTGDDCPVCRMAVKWERVESLGS